MTATIAALAYVPFFVAVTAAQGTLLGSDPSGSGSAGSVDAEGLDASSLRTPDELDPEGPSTSPSRVAGRLKGQPGDIVVAFFADLRPGQYALSDLPLQSAVHLGFVGNDGQFELREGPAQLATATVALAVLPLAPGSGPSLAQVCLYTLPSGPIVCGCTPGWNNLGGGADNLVSAVGFKGKGLFAGGDFTSIGGTAANYVARWNANGWNSLQGGLSGVQGYTNPQVRRFQPYQGRVYTAGHFLDAGGMPVNHIASFKGSTGWLDLAGGVDDPGNWYIVLNDMVLFDDGGGSDLYVAGDFYSAGGVVVNDIARWDGSNWSDVGGGTNFHEQVTALGTYNNGGTNVLVAAGGFQAIGGVSVNYIAQWDGSAWSAIASSINDDIYAIEPFGGDLYIAGRPTIVDGVSVSRIARWDGSAWYDVGGGTDNSIFDMTVFDDGSGPALIVTGYFNSAGGVPGTHGIAKWDGNSWSAFAGGEITGTGYSVDAIPGCLAISGYITAAGGTPVNNVATWGCGCP